MYRHNITSSKIALEYNLGLKHLKASANSKDSNQTVNQAPRFFMLNSAKHDILNANKY